MAYPQYQQQRPPAPAGPPPTVVQASPLSITKSFRPYYSPAELVLLVKQNATAPSDGPRREFSEARVEGWRQLACGFIERVGGRLGFPRRTIATAQTLYHRFHLHFPLKDFDYHDVTVAALLVASKLEDTLKKLRDIQIAAWQITNLMDGGTGMSDGDPTTQEAHRPQLIAVERLILQTICFNFNLHRSPFVATDTSSSSAISGLVALESGVAGRDVFGWVIRLARALDTSKSYALLSHLLAIDIHRTLVPLSYPPHTVALACLFLTSFLIPGARNSLEWRGEEVTVEMVQSGLEGPDWSRTRWNEWESDRGDVLEISHSLLNLLLLLFPPSPPTASALPSTNPSPSFSPSFPSPSPSSTDPSLSLLPLRPTNNSNSASKEKHVLQSGVPHSLSGQVPVVVRGEDDLRRIKIRLREMEKELSADMNASGSGGGVWGIQEAEMEGEGEEGTRKRRRDEEEVEDGGAEGDWEEERREEKRALSVRYRF